MSLDGRRGRVDGMHRYFDGRHIGHPGRGRAAVSRDHLTVRGARRDDFGVLDRSRRCRGDRGGRGAGRHSGIGLSGLTENHQPRRHWRRTRGRRPMSQDTPRSPQATARQLHRRALRSNAGPHRPRRGTADRPAKLTSHAGPARRRGAGRGSFPAVPAEKTPGTQSVPLRRTAFRGVSHLPDC